MTQAPGGVAIFPVEAITDSSGLACTDLTAGSVPTTVQVIATLEVGGLKLISRSTQIVISGGKPSAKYLNFSCEMLNVGGFSVERQEAD